MDSDRAAIDIEIEYDEAFAAHAQHVLTGSEEVRLRAWEKYKTLGPPLEHMQYVDRLLTDAGRGPDDPVRADIARELKKRRWSHPASER